MTREIVMWKHRRDVTRSINLLTKNVVSSSSSNARASLASLAAA